MRLTRRSIEKASEVQRATVVGWYTALCGAICLLGGIWAIAAFGDFGGPSDRGKVYQTAVKRASREAAEQRTLLRLAAEEEARNIAADAKKPITEPLPTQPGATATETPQAASSPPAAAASATPTK